MKKVSYVLLLTCVAILHLKSATGMGPGESSGTAHNRAPGKVRVTFNDNEYAEDAITPHPIMPRWLNVEGDYHPFSARSYQGSPRLIFQTYEIYTTARVEDTGLYTTNKYISHSVVPEYSKKRIPVKGELDVYVGQSTQTFKTYFFKVYDAYEYLARQYLYLPREGRYGEVNGFILIAMKGTKLIYIGELYLQKRDTINALPGSALTRAAIWPERNQPSGKVQVSFKDHIDVTASLEPTEERPEWIESRYGRSNFKSYSMYTMIHAEEATVATYTSDTTVRKGGRVSNVNNHIPIKARLDINVGPRTETFKTDRFRDYNPETLRTLPFSETYGEVIGYIIITIKGSRSIYVGIIYVHKSNFNNVPVRSGLSTIQMMPDGHGVSIYESEPPLRKIRVDFLDSTSFEALLTPMRDRMPIWMEAEDPRNRRSPFQKYFIFTVIQAQHGIASYLSESYGPENVLSGTDNRKHYVADKKKHLPVKAKLHVNVGQTTAIFKSYFLEPYDAYHNSLSHPLPFHEKYGEVFGYIFMTIRGTKDIYVGPLHVYRTV